MTTIIIYDRWTDGYYTYTGYSLTTTRQSYKTKSIFLHGKKKLRNIHDVAKVYYIKIL
jgi:hypothetical protein